MFTRIIRIPSYTRIRQHSNASFQACF